jgi:hypothetical protein
MPQKKATRWSSAVYWRDIAIDAGIGVTGGKDNNFTWDTASYNAVPKVAKQSGVLFYLSN